MGLDFRGPVTQEGTIPRTTKGPLRAREGLNYWWLTGLMLAVGCAATSSSAGAPPLADRYSRTLSARFLDTASLTECRLAKVDLGPTEPARLRRFPVVLTLPSEFGLGPFDLLRKRVWHPMLQARWQAEEWVPGIYIEQARHYRWSRVHATAGSGVIPPTTLFQLVVRSRPAYPLIHIDPPWVFAEATECLVQLETGTARVLRFSLRHPTEAAQWGAMASWRLHGTTSLGLLALGPDEAVQEESLEILRRVHH